MRPRAFLTRLFAILAAAALMAIIALPARAQFCTVASTPGNYGSVNPLSGAAVTTTATVTVTCNTCLLSLGCLTNVCLQLNQGSPATSSTPRLMSNGVQTIQHELYSDAAYSHVWGSWGYNTTSYGTGGVSQNVVVPLVGAGTYTYTVYGQLKAGQQTAVPGTYTWSTNSPVIAYGGYLLASPNCGSDPGNYANAGSAPWTVTITANCNVSTTPLNFGTASFLTAAIDATAVMSVQCTNTTPYSISLDNGGNASGGQRRMRLGASSNYVSYNLYTNAADTNAWTSSTSPTSCTSGAGTCVLGTGTGLTQSVNIYGQVPPQSSPVTGTYNDTVIITVTY